MIQGRNLFLLVGLFLVVLSVGTYFVKGSFAGILSGGRNFLVGLLATAEPSNTGSEEPGGETNIPASAGGASGTPAKECSFETSEEPRRDSLILNEIAWMGVAGDAKNEWIEFKNVSPEAADLSGSHLLNENGKIKIYFGSGTKIPPGGFYVLGTAKYVAEGVEADSVYKGALRNSGDSLRLFDGDCHLMDEVAAASGWPAGNNETKKTMERDPETLAWHTSSVAGGTPGKENTFAAKPPASAAVKARATVTAPSESVPAATTTASKMPSNQPSAVSAQPPLCSTDGPRALSHPVLINEVAWAGVSSNKTAEEWIELKNNSGSDISLGGWQIQNRGQNIKIFFAASDSIPSGGFYLLERGSADFLTGVKADKFFVNAIKNSDESILIFDKNCGVADEVIAGVGAGNNWPAGTASPDYRTAERSPDFSWHTYSGPGTAGIMGTPHAENSPPPLAPTIASNQNQSSPTPSPSPTYYTLQVLKSGNGSGTVTSAPSGIACATSCTEDSEDFLSGTSVELTAAADDGSEFTGWSGDCSGSATCSLSINSNKSATAVFSQVTSSTPPKPATTTISSTVRSNANHILISQVQTTGGSGQTMNDFVEIYNPTGSQFDLKGYRLVKRTQIGASDTLIKSWTSDAFIPAYGFYLWANSGFAAVAAVPDATTTASIADDNGIAIRYGANDTGTIIDSVAWGNAENVFVENAVFTDNPGANQGLLRRGWQDACVAASFDASVGNGCDMDNNASDFELAPGSQPRNSQSR